MPPGDALPIVADGDKPARNPGRVSPADLETFRRGLGTNGPYADMRGPDGRIVRVDVYSATKHLTVDHPERSSLWPYIRDAIAEAYKISPVAPGPGDKFYSSILEDVETGEDRYFGTWVEEDARGRRRWKTMFPTSRRRNENLAKRAEKETRNPFGVPRFRGNTGHSTPTATPRRTGASRSERTPVIAQASYAKYSTRRLDWLALGALASAAAMVALAAVRDREVFHAA